MSKQQQQQNKVLSESEIATFTPILELVKAAVKDSYDVELKEQDAQQLLSKFEVPDAEQDFGHSVALPTFIIAKALMAKKPKDQNFNEFCAATATAIVANIKQKTANHPQVQDVAASGPYMNFFYKSAFLAKVIAEINSGSFLQARPAKNENVMIEYSQPNTHKVFHVGHMRNAALGNSLVQLFEFCGYKVIAANYIGDVGTHIAKCLWYYEHFYAEKTGNIEKDAPKDMPHVEWLGDMYAKACDELDFTRWCTLPNPGFMSAKVTSIENHPTNPAWKIVQVNCGEGFNFTVVCGGKGYKLGDIVAYAPVGSRFNGKEVDAADFKGVTSQGLILSEKELDKGDDRNKIFILDADTKVGWELPEATRLPNCSLPANIKIADEMHKRESQVKATLKRLEEKEPYMHKVWELTREWCLEDFRKIYDWVGCRFDHFFHESDVGDESKEIVIEAHKKGLLISSGGAIVADLQKHKLGVLVLLTRAGTGLYATKDLALAKLKFDKYNIDRSIYVVDASQSLHFQQVFKTLEILGFKQAPKCYHLAYGLVTLPDGKMSSRKGNIIEFSKLKNLLMKRIYMEFMSKHKDKPEWSDEAIEESTRRIAIGTIKYGMLNQDNNKDIVFDINEWTARTGNTGPYLMYAYTRTSSIQRKCPVSDEEKAQVDLSLLTDEGERRVLQLLNAFVDTVAKATENYRPQLLCIYLFNLAKHFSRMYERMPVKDAPTVALKVTRLELVKAVGAVLNKGLALLGIQTIERM